MFRRTLLKSAAAAVASAPLVRPRAVRAQETPGVTATEIKIGNTMPYSGNASDYAVIGKAQAAFFRMVNDQGGIAGRRIQFISLDDALSPPRTVEQTRKLVEEDGVAFMLGSLGTPTNSAVQKYLNDNKVPQLFVWSGADKWGNHEQHPWTIGWMPSYRVEARIYAKYILEHNPDARVGILYRNDDFGKDYIAGLKDVLGGKFDRMAVSALSHEATDPTVDSQIVSLQSAGADAFVLASAAKFAAQAIRKASDIGWKPALFVMSYTAAVGAVIKPAGPERAVGIVTAEFLKDPTDPAWADDPGLREWRAFMTKYLPDADQSDVLYEHGYGIAQTMAQALRQCGNDLSRENIMRQATSLRDLELPVLLPGIKVNTGASNYHPIRQMQLARWSGKTWERFGDIIEGSSA